MNDQFQTDNVRFSSTHHKPLDHEKTGFLLCVSEAVVAGNRGRVAQVHLKVVAHRQLQLPQNWKRYIYQINRFDCGSPGCFKAELLFCIHYVWQKSDSRLMPI